MPNCSARTLHPSKKNTNRTPKTSNAIAINRNTLQTFTPFKLAFFKWTPAVLFFCFCPFQQIALCVDAPRSSEFHIYCVNLRKKWISGYNGLESWRCFWRRKGKESLIFAWLPLGLFLRLDWVVLYVYFGRCDAPDPSTRTPTTHLRNLASTE